MGICSRRSLLDVSVCVGLLALGTSALANAQPGPTPKPGELESRLRTARGTKRVEILNSLAEAHVVNAPARAIEYAEQALRLAREAGETRGEADALLHIGAANNARSRYPDALAAFGKVLPLLEKLGDRKTIASVEHHRGNAYFFMSRYQEAIAHYSQALALREALGDQRGIADTVNSLGNIYCHLGEGSPKGLQHYGRALEIYRKIGDQEGIARALGNMGLVYSAVGDYARALEVALQALRIDEGLQNADGIGRHCGNIGILYAQMGQYEKAVVYKERALRIARERGDRASVAGQLNDLGIIYRRTKQPRKALQHYRESLRIKEEIGDTAGTESNLNNIGNLYNELGDHAQALEYYRKALRLSRESGNGSGLVVSLRNLGAAQTGLRRFGEASASLSEALRLAEKSGNRELVRDVHQGLSELYEESGDVRKAFAEYRAYVEVKDAILHKETSDKIAELQTKYEAEGRERQIETLRRDNELQQLRLRAQHLRLLALAGGLGVLLALLALLLQRLRRLRAFWRSKSYVGPYRLLQEVGSGGMGVVYKAHHVRDKTQPVAIKVLREEHTQDPVLRQRLKNEAVLIDQLNHPNIVKVRERGEANGRLYIAMEWLDGRSLAQLLRDEPQRLPLADCLGVMSQLAETLTKIHSKGIVHRDLKPENIMLVEQDGRRLFVKLLDFDIARNASLTRLTETGVVVGTIGYLAPERIRQQADSAASDVYALGVVFYELLTREKPFFGQTPIDVVRQILEREPVPPAALRPEMPPEIDALILQMLSKEPEQRPSDVRLMERLDQLQPAAG